MSTAKENEEANHIPRNGVHETSGPGKKTLREETVSAELYDLLFPLSHYPRRYSVYPNRSLKKDTHA